MVESPLIQMSPMTVLAQTIIQVAHSLQCLPLYCFYYSNLCRFLKLERFRKLCLCGAQNSQVNLFNKDVKVFLKFEHCFTEEMRFHGFHGLRDNETIRAQKTQPPSSGSEEQIRILIEGKDYITKIPVSPLFKGSLQFNLN